MQPIILIEGSALLIALKAFLHQGFILFTGQEISCCKVIVCIIKPWRQCKNADFFPLKIGFQLNLVPDKLSVQDHIKKSKGLNCEVRFQSDLTRLIIAK